MDNKINIFDDYILIGEKKLVPPFSLADLVNQLGDAKKIILNEDDIMYKEIHYIWDSLGIDGIDYDDNGILSCIRIQIDPNEKSLVNTVFGGDIFIDSVNYKDCVWDYEYSSNIMKKGYFEIFTLLPEKKILFDEEDIELGEWYSSKIEINYVKPRKLVKYKHKKITEPELIFSDFNFKLAVVQRLMYEKELLLPKFDVFEFAEEYEKREIDPFDEGDEPIKEVITWFKKLQIPISLADEVDEIVMDGGNEVYHQIIPYWDGEDGYYDLKKVTSEDLLQLKNLKRAVLMAKNYEMIAKVFEDCGIDTRSL